MQAPSLVLRRLQSNTMQHPLTGATCVALPNVGMCPQLSCALTFMYLQQVSLLNFFLLLAVLALSASFGGFAGEEVFFCVCVCVNRLYKCLPPCGASVVPALKNVRVSRKYILTKPLQIFWYFRRWFIL